jgi:serine/threonine protein phosphatase 1
MNSLSIQHEHLDTAASVPDGARVYAIGDIHGRADLLDRMHGLIEADFVARATSAVHLVYLGDYIDRGQDSFGVVERLAEGPREFVQASLLRGNHEELLLRFIDDPSVGPFWRQLGGLATLLSYGIDVDRVLKDAGYPGLSKQLRAQLPSHHLALFTRLKPFTTIGDYFFCHAGVRPGIPLEQQKQQDMLWIRDQFLDAAEDFGKIIVHGHSPVEQPVFRKNRINIDTGAYATGRLTCLVLEGRSRRILST